MEIREVSPGQKRPLLVVNKDFAAGEVIYKVSNLIQSLRSALTILTRFLGIPCRSYTGL